VELLFLFLAEFVLLFFLSRKLSRAISYALFRITRNSGIALRLFHFLFLPGVLIHELAHLISAEVMFVKTHGLKLTPERDGDQVTMGTVEINKTDPIRRAIIGFAPVFVGFIIISLSTFYFLSDRSPLNLIASYAVVFLIVFEIGNTMFSSKKDLEGTAELLLVIGLIIGIMYIFGFNFPDFSSFFNSEQVREIMLRGIKILAFPIGIDLVIIFLSNYLSPRH
jgi:hypothetical protein